MLVVGMRSRGIGFFCMADKVARISDQLDDASAARDRVTQPGASIL